MGIGTSVRNAVTAAINVIGSTVTITPYTQATTDDGYSGQVETDGTPVTEIAIPFEEFQRIMKEKFGDLETAGFQLALKYSATFDISGTTKYKITYNGDTYNITEPRRYAIENTLVAWIITLSKRLT